MPIINKGTTFSNGEQLTADKINNLLDLATFNESSTDSASTTVNSASQIIVRDSGVTTAKLATDAVETAKIKDANVTKAKIEDVADYKVLGNVSGATAAPAEVSILDEDDMTSDSATALATQQSIKAYVDSISYTPNIVQAVKSDTFVQSNPSGVFVDIPGLSVSITPGFASSKFLINADASGASSYTNNPVRYRFVRDDIAIGIGDVSGTAIRASFVGEYSRSFDHPQAAGGSYLDSSTNVAGTPVVYKLQATAFASFTINRGTSGAVQPSDTVAISTLTVTEIPQ